MDLQLVCTSVLLVGVSLYTVWKKIIFHDLNDYNPTNMPDNHKIPFDYS